MARKAKKPATDDVEPRPTIHNELMQPIFAGPMEKAGITAQYLADKLKEELEATMIRTYSYEGSIIETDPLIAWDIRQRARKDAHELLGHYPPKQIESKHDHTGRIVHDLDERLKKAAEATIDAIRNGNGTLRESAAKK